MDRHYFVLYWDAKPVGEIFVGHGHYTIEDAKKKWNINFAETTPIEIKEQVERIFVHRTEPNSTRFIVSALKNFERALCDRIFEPHDEETSCKNFPENIYKKIKDPLLKKLVKGKITEWANSQYFGTGPTKTDLKDLVEKLEEIDKAEISSQ
jgi:hypothetical protein